MVGRWSKTRVLEYGDVACHVWYAGHGLWAGETDVSSPFPRHYAKARPFPWLSFSITLLSLGAMIALAWV